MRILVTGLAGQVARAMIERGALTPDVALIAVGRPELDLARPETIAPAIRSHRPDVVVNAAAYTAVDAAESDEAAATAANGEAAGIVAAAARALGAPIVQISTDYVFDGAKGGPYVETDPVAPIGAYGRSKLAGEVRVAAENPDHAILRTAWVYDADGKNFLNTMLRLAASRDELGVVADQRGAPTYAPDIAAAAIQIARALRSRADVGELRGIFHMTGGGEATWADFAEAIFAGAATRGGPSARVRRIATADYPTPARRPANSRLDNRKLREIYGISLPSWRDALERCLDRKFNLKGAA